MKSNYVSSVCISAQTAHFTSLEFHFCVSNLLVTVTIHFYITLFNFTLAVHCFASLFFLFFLYFSNLLPFFLPLFAFNLRSTFYFAFLFRFSLSLCFSFSLLSLIALSCFSLYFSLTCTLCGHISFQRPILFLAFAFHHFHQYSHHHRSLPHISSSRVCSFSFVCSSFNLIRFLLLFSSTFLFYLSLSLFLFSLLSFCFLSLFAFTFPSTLLFQFSTSRTEAGIGRSKSDLSIASSACVAATASFASSAALDLSDT